MEQCAWGTCKKNSIAGSMYCRKHHEPGDYDDCHETQSTELNGDESARLEDEAEERQ